MTSPLEPNQTSSTQETKPYIKEESDQPITDVSVDDQETKKLDGRELRAGEAAAQEETSASSAEAQTQSRAELRKQQKQDEADDRKGGRASRNKSDSESETEDEEQAASRAEMRKKERKTTRQLKVRVFPIWLRLIVIVVFCAAALVGGAMVGYGIIGKGNPMDVFNMDTWTHIRDIIYAKK